jgi:hypothetical protein
MDKIGTDRKHKDGLKHWGWGSAVYNSHSFGTVDGRGSGHVHLFAVMVGSVWVSMAPCIHVLGQGRYAARYHHILLFALLRVSGVSSEQILLVVERFGGTNRRFSHDIFSC